MRKAVPAIALATLLAACGGSQGNNAAAVDANGAMMDVEEVPADEGPAGGDAADLAVPGDTAVTDGWVGRWTGPEGLFLTIAKGASPGSYDLVVKGDLDSNGDPFTGTAEGETIRFARGGATEAIRKATGDQTGLKYLAGKQDCLMIKPGEGFCRD